MKHLIEINNELFEAKKKQNSELGRVIFFIEYDLDTNRFTDINGIDFYGDSNRPYLPPDSIDNVGIYDESAPAEVAELYDFAADMLQNAVTELNKKIEKA